MKANLVRSEQHGRPGQPYGVFVQFTTSDGKMHLVTYPSVDAAMIAANEWNDKAKNSDVLHSVRIDPAVGAIPYHPGEVVLIMTEGEARRLKSLALMLEDNCDRLIELPETLYIALNGLELNYPKDEAESLATAYENAILTSAERIKFNRLVKSQGIAPNGASLGPVATEMTEAALETMRESGSRNI